MIQLTDKTRHDFLDKRWIERFKEANVPMGDNTYWIVDIDGTEYISDDKVLPEQSGFDCYPTYTLSQLLYKILEWHDEYKGFILWKDAPFYFCQYQQADDSSPFVCYREYPIESAAQLIINCVKEGFGCVKDISVKYSN